VIDNDVGIGIVVLHELVVIRQCQFVSPVSTLEAIKPSYSPLSHHRVFEYSQINGESEFYSREKNGLYPQR